MDKTKQITIHNQNIDSRITALLVEGNLAALTPAERILYYKNMCEAHGLSLASRPFDFIKFQGNKISLYANKSCTDQLRQIHSISLEVKTSQICDGNFEVFARATCPDGRFDEDLGCVSVANAKGEALCNAKMKAVTKAKRRVTLSICGLTIPDETEIDSIPGAKRLTEKDGVLFEDDASPVNLKNIEERERLKSDLMSAYNEFKNKNPKIVMSEFLEKKYQVKEYKSLTLDQVKDLILTMKEYKEPEKEESVTQDRNSFDSFTR